MGKCNIPETGHKNLRFIRHHYFFCSKFKEASEDFCDQFLRLEIKVILLTPIRFYGAMIQCLLKKNRLVYKFISYLFIIYRSYEIDYLVTLAKL